MVLFFFYDKLTNIELLKKINDSFEINDAYVLVNKYNKLDNILEISKESIDNNILLHGKIVNFNMNIDDIIKKINEIQECRIQNKTKYTMDTIWANKKTGGSYKTYIIY